MIKIYLNVSAERNNWIFGLFVCNGDTRMLISNGIFIFLFKASHLTTLVVCLLVFYYIMDV